MDKLKVSCVMCTYGRFNEVQRSMSFFIDQDYENKELIIFNTAPTPLVLNEALYDQNIKVFNNEISYETKLPYTSIGQVRSDAMNVITGDVYVCWDDDDYYLPFHLSLGMENLIKSKPLELIKN